MVNVRNEIKKRVDASDRQFVQESVERFEKTSDRDELLIISSEMFPYEKKYVHPYQSDCDVLISTVGMREAPIILSHLAIRPKRSILLHTVGSESAAEDVMADPDIKDIGIDFTLVQIDEVDAAYNYNQLKKEVLPRIGDRQNVRTDPTGGRKIMGTAVGSFAFFFRIPMVYLHAEEKMGISVPFSGQIRDIENPYDYYGDIEFSMLKSSFDKYDFDMSLELCNQLRDTVKDPALDTKLRLVGDMIEVYRDWDVFLHSRNYLNPRNREDRTYLGTRLGRVKDDLDRFGYQLIDKQLLLKNVEFLEHLEESWENKRSICDKYRLIDLYLNAVRRSEQGRFDDATARLYRCIEMCSTLELKKNGLEDPDNPDYAAFAKNAGTDVDTISREFETKVGYPLPSRISLNHQMMLLSIVDGKNVIFKIYGTLQKQKPGVVNLMDRRNRSILAHGTNPITRDDYDGIESRIKPMIIEAIGENGDEFDGLKKQSKFPKLIV